MSFTTSEDRASTQKCKPQAQKRGKKTPKKISETYLHNAGLYYLERFASSSANFRDVMMRKVKRSCMAHPEQDFERCAEMVDKLVDKFIRSGLLDDETYTRTVVNSLRRRGKSTRAITSHLRSKGLSADLIEQALAAHDSFHEDAEFEAAMTFARKKRIGPYRTKEISEESDLKKELGRLARAGFSYDTSRRVLNCEEQESF